MRQQKWQSGQRVTRQDLSRAQTSKEEAIKGRLTDNFTSGVAANLLNGMNFVVGTTTTSLTIRTGTAYNSNGELVTILSESITYNSAAPTTTTADGLGGFTLTPQSTGSKDIPVAAGSVSLLYIQYLETTDPVIFSLHKVTNKKLFTKVDDGYEIRVVDVGNVNPSTVDIVTNAPSGGPWIFLGLVDFRVGSTISASMFDLARRPRYEIQVPRVQQLTPKADRTDVTPPANYGFEKLINYEQHIKAIGSGTPTAANPHGLTLSDIGFSGKTVEQHENFLHTNGIANGDMAPNIGNSLNLKVNPKCPDLDELIIYGLTSLQFLIVDNITLDTNDLFGVGGTKTLSFVGKATGTYYIWANTTTRTVEFSMVAPILSELNKFLLWTINFNTTKGASNISVDHFITAPSGPCAGNCNFTTLVDNRLFGNTGSDVLQVDGATNTFDIEHNVEITGHLTATARIANGTFTANNNLVTANNIISLGERPRIVATSTSVATIFVGLSSYTATTTISGPGGLIDSFVSWTPSTWYALGLIFSEDLLLASAVFSPTGTPFPLPTGYTKYKRVGWVRSNSTTTFRLFLQAGDWWYWNGLVGSYGSGASQSLAADVPPTSSLFDAQINLDGGGTAGKAITITATGTSSTGICSISVGGSVTHNSNSVGLFTCNTLQQVDVSATGASFNTRGYYDPV